MEQNSIDSIATEIERLSGLLRAQGVSPQLLGSGRVVVVDRHTGTGEAMKEEEQPVVNELHDSNTSDVLLVVKKTGVIIHAHSETLSQRSLTLKQRFETESFANGRMRCTELDVPSVDTLESTLQYLYHGSLHGCDFSGSGGADPMMGVMQNADYLISDSLTAACRDMIKRTVISATHEDIVAHRLFTVELVPASLVKDVLKDPSLQPERKLRVALQWAKGCDVTPSQALPVRQLAIDVSKKLVKAEVLKLYHEASPQFDCILGGAALAGQIEFTSEKLARKEQELTAQLDVRSEQLARKEQQLKWLDNIARCQFCDQCRVHISYAFKLKIVTVPKEELIT